MGHEKAIIHGKEHRKPYRGAKSVDSSCRNHGGCSWCTNNRLFQRRRVEEAAKDEIKEISKLPENNGQV